MCIKAGYREIAANLKKQILCGTYQCGDMLPSTRILASTYGVSLLTANKALNLLHEEGFLDRRHGSGTFLSGKIPKPPKYRQRQNRQENRRFLPSRNNRILPKHRKNRRKT